MHSDMCISNFQGTIYHKLAYAYVPSEKRRFQWQIYTAHFSILVVNLFTVFRFTANKLRNNLHCFYAIHLH